MNVSNAIMNIPKDIKSWKENSSIDITSIHREWRQRHPATRLENLDLELANDVTTMFLNANGVAGDVTQQMVNFLEYVKTQVPNDAYTRELEAEVARLKLDKEVRRKYMVLQAELRDTEIVAFEAGEAKGHAAGLAEGREEGIAQGLAEGEAKKSRETALEMLKDREPLTKIMKYSKLAKEDILLLAKENGIEVVVA